MSLKFGSTLDPTNIKENDDVYFECGIKAKPWVYKIEWKFEVRSKLGGTGERRFGNYFCVECANLSCVRGGN